LVEPHGVKRLASGTGVSQTAQRASSVRPMAAYIGCGCARGRMHAVECSEEPSFAASVIVAATLLGICASRAWKSATWPGRTT
jgi:hydroxyethylthiazole kinase-like sugar kinase family protein